MRGQNGGQDCEDGGKVASDGAFAVFWLCYFSPPPLAAFKTSGRHSCNDHGHDESNTHEREEVRTFSASTPFSSASRCCSPLFHLYVQAWRALCRSIITQSSSPYRRKDKETERCFVIYSMAVVLMGFTCYRCRETHAQEKPGS